MFTFAAQNETIQSSAPNYKKQWKMMLVGMANAGKSTWLNSATNEKFIFLSYKPYYPGSISEMQFRITFINENKLQLWRLPDYRSLSGYAQRPFLFNISARFRGCKAALVLLDLSLTESELQLQIKDLKSWELSRIDDSMVYYIGTKLDLLASEREGLDKLKSLLRGMNIDSENCFVTSAKTGFGIQACLSKIDNDITCQYSVNDFIADYRVQYTIEQSKRWFFNSMYPTPPLLNMINNTESVKKLNFHTIFSDKDARTKTVLEAAGIDDVSNVSMNEPATLVVRSKLSK